MIGSLEVICGCMYASKSSLLLARLRREKIAKKRVVLLKPSLDNRYKEDEVVSHDFLSLPAIPIQLGKSFKIPELAEGADVVGIDEVQFFNYDIVNICNYLINLGIKVIVAGLDQDYQGNPFGQLPTLLALADKVDKLQAVCTVCGAPATKTQRLTNSKELIQVGGFKEYEARCRLHWSPEPLEEIQGSLPL